MSIKHTLQMTLFAIITVSVNIIIFGFLNPVKAGGVFANNIFVQSAPTESRALIVYDGKKETIFETVTFNINPVVAWNFELVIAVPGKPTVEFVLDDLIKKLEKVSEKTLTKNTFLDRLLYFDVYEEKNIPKDLYVRSVDLTNYEVFGPEKSVDDLNNYLAESGYIIPKDGAKLMEEYHQKGWYFIAAEINGNHLQMDASESLTVPGARNYPIKIEFETNKIIYPLKLAKIQPDYDSTDTPLSYEYGSKSENVLGIKDEKVDEQLSIQSKNKYPRLPLDYGYQKVELFVLSDKEVTTPGVTVSFADRINKNKIDFTDFKQKKYFELPDKKMFLTRMYAFVPNIQLEDIEINTVQNNRLVNTKPPLLNQIAKILIYFVVPAILFSMILIRKSKNAQK